MQKKVSRPIRAKSSIVNTPVHIRPDHSVQVKHVQRFQNINVAANYFDAYQDIKPFEILSNSSWSHLLDIYESMRVTSIRATVWIVNTSVSTQGCTSGFLYRDVVPSVPSRYYEQLIVEPGSQKGKAVKSYNFKWLPIEPVDYDFYDHSQFAQMDSVRYGQINFSGAGFVDEFRPYVLIEYSVHYDFKSLVKPEGVPQKSYQQRSDSESSIVTIDYGRSKKPITKSTRK